MQIMHVLESRVTNREQNATADDTMAAKVVRDYVHTDMARPSCSYANSSLIDDQTAGDQLINCEVVGKWQRELENNYEIITRLHCVIEKTA